jgi:hypothetical protein
VGTGTLNKAQHVGEGGGSTRYEETSRRVAEVNL